MPVRTSLRTSIRLSKSRVHLGEPHVNSGEPHLHSGVHFAKSSVDPLFEGLKLVLRNYPFAQLFIEDGGQFQRICGISHLRPDEGITNSPHVDDRHVSPSRGYAF